MGYVDYDLSFATPTLTKMAGEGIVLSNYYSMEVCTPARGALLTGRYPLSTGLQYGLVNIDRPWGLDLSEQLLGSALQNEGYQTHIVGKWHLGHHSPRYLPTARGFDTFVGFLSGNNYYHSKRNPVNPKFIDFLEANQSCYSPYVRQNMHNYSTHFYGHRAIQLINEHDKGKPLFLFLPFQAVHDPFQDIVQQRDIASTFVTDTMREQIETTVVGTKRKQVAYALAVLDSTVEKIKQALVDNAMMDNSYIIFASDNGGCHTAGGKNGPLRGTKGSLLEGGTKVDAFIYSPLLPAARVGAKYDHLFHVTDWFPTLMDLVGRSFVARDDHPLDGVSHYANFMDGDAPAPRTYMLYNSYYNVRTQNLDMWTDGAFAIRDDRYKLIHFFDNSVYGGWYDAYVENADDDNADVTECSSVAEELTQGDFVYALFDLQNDPYETTNIYAQGDEKGSDIAARRAALYAKLDEAHAASKVNLASAEATSEVAPQVWKEVGHDYIVPWVEVEAESIKASNVYSHVHPVLCMPTFEGHSYGLMQNYDNSDGESG